MLDDIFCCISLTFGAKELEWNFQEATDARKRINLCSLMVRSLACCVCLWLFTIIKMSSGGGW